MKGAVQKRVAVDEEDAFHDNTEEAKKRESEEAAVKCLDATEEAKKQ